jgi:hypothetical protein
MGFNEHIAFVLEYLSVVKNVKAFCRTFVLEVDIWYLVKRRSPIGLAMDVMKILACLNEVTELCKVGSCESKIAGAIVNNNFCPAFVTVSEEESDSDVVQTKWYHFST